MTLSNTNVLISGASIAGPVLAYWLQRYGFTPTVVERAPTLRKTGGHAVDLIGAGVDVAERTGVLPQVEAARTRTEWASTIRVGKRPIDIEVSRLAVLSDRHIEIMRDDLSEILYERSRDEVEYVFGDSIRSLEEDAEGVKVSFERGAPRRFDLVVGADGLHSNVRRLVFGDESAYRHDIGTYFAVYTVPNHLRLQGRVLLHNQPGSAVAFYGVHGSDEARAIFMWRRAEPLHYDHRDVEQQKRILREAFAGASWELVPRLLEELEDTPIFYFDSIAQILLEPWSRGRVTLAGDAGYCPGPVVGGSTSLAVVGAYVLAGELAAAGGDHRVAFPGYERELHPYVRDNRSFAFRGAKVLLPDTRFQVWRNAQVTKLLRRLPAGLVRRLLALGNSGLGALAETPLKDYGPLKDYEPQL